jgi:hypothetical protein
VVLLVTSRFGVASITSLDEIPADTAERAIGAELRAQVHYWRSQALMGRGDRAGAQTDADTGRKFVDSLVGSLPQQFRRGFGARRDIRALVE